MYVCLKVIPTFLEATTPMSGGDVVLRETAVCTCGRAMNHNQVDFAHYFPFRNFFKYKSHNFSSKVFRFACETPTVNKASGDKLTRE